MTQQNQTLLHTSRLAQPLPVQVFGTFILTGCILAITDGRNMKPNTGLLPLALGSIVFAIGTCWALNCGYAINPARDLGPRIFTAIAGWGVEPFRSVGRVG